MEPVTVTVLVGDIHSYTRLVQKAPRKQLQDSVARVFNVLERPDSSSRRNPEGVPGRCDPLLLGEWPQSGPRGRRVSHGDRTVALDTAAGVGTREYGTCRDSRSDWDWSLATGEVVIETVGGDRPTGLSMIGEPVVLAYRLEKLASAEIGSIVVAESTWHEAKDHFEFIDRGKARVAGFEGTTTVLLAGPGVGGTLSSCKQRWWVQEMRSRAGLAKPTCCSSPVRSG